MITNYKCTFGLKEGKNTSVTRKQIPSQREQYGSTVHLFIGTLANNYIVTRRGLNSFFIFKSVSFSAIMPKLFCAQLRLRAILRIPFVLLHTAVLT
jgi:hypothetical protein